MSEASMIVIHVESLSRVVGCRGRSGEFVLEHALSERRGHCGPYLCVGLHDVFPRVDHG